ncbi:MAG: hypothetical protein LUH42_08095 [Oscillospiraceae bacterium]|nr:hypothetical protein [Oscillospiraceae bacterium]
MTPTEALDILLKSYRSYYDITLHEEPDALFAAEAVFLSHGEQYFLLKKAVVSESESNEYVFIATVDTLDESLLQRLDEAAWTTGLGHVVPHSSHRNTDITLIILADSITAEAKAAVKKLHHYKSYRFGLQGWSNYRLVALETSTGTLAYNRLGGNLKKLFRNIISLQK